jgi:hypothetical protein
MNKAVVRIGVTASVIAIVTASVAISSRIHAGAESDPPSAENVALACRSSATEHDAATLAALKTVCGMSRTLLLDPEAAFLAGGIRDRREVDWFIETRNKCLPREINAQIIDDWAKQTQSDPTAPGTPYFASLRRYVLARCGKNP